jgi:hypothetical protein
MCECVVHRLSVFTPFNLVSCVIGRSASQYFEYGLSIRCELQKHCLLYGCTYIMLPGSSIVEWFILILGCNFFWPVIASSFSFTKFTISDNCMHFYISRLLISTTIRTWLYIFSMECVLIFLLKSVVKICHAVHR